MHLKKEQVLHLSQQIFDHLKEKELMVLKTNAAEVLERIQQAIAQDLKSEESLNEEAEKILQQYKRQIAQGGLNERELFLKIKKELAKKKGIVL